MKQHFKLCQKITTKEKATINRGTTDEQKDQREEEDASTNVANRDREIFSKEGNFRPKLFI